MLNLWPFLFLCFFQGDNDELIIQERFRVDFVRLDILALDKQGNPVTDLKAEDFIIKEGRKKIDLEFFERIDYRQAFEARIDSDQKLPLPAEEIEAGENTRPQYIFATDLESVPLVRMRKTFTQLREALEKGNFPEQADYLLYSMESGVIGDGWVPGYKGLIHAVNQFEDRMSDRYAQETNGRGGNSNQPVRGSGRSSSRLRDLSGLESEVDSCLLRLKGGMYSPEDKRVAYQCVSEVVELYVEQEELAVKRVIGELEALTLRFQDRKGMKTLFFISPGFSLMPGQAATRIADIVVRDELKNLEGFPFDFMSIPNDMDEEFRRVSHACIRNRVVFHTFDIFTPLELAKSNYHAGGRSSTEAVHKSNARSYSLGLSTLATESGGFHSMAPNLSISLNKVVPRLKFHYLLGYASPEGKPGKYRKIKIKCKRKGVTLHYRRGYFGKS